jgi:hypothetical protein
MAAMQRWPSIDRRGWIHALHRTHRTFEQQVRVGEPSEFALNFVEKFAGKDQYTQISRRWFMLVAVSESRTPTVQAASLDSFPSARSRPGVHSTTKKPPRGVEAMKAPPCETALPAGYEAFGSTASVLC